MSCIVVIGSGVKSVSRGGLSPLITLEGLRSFSSNMAFWPAGAAESWDIDATVIPPSSTSPYFSAMLEYFRSVLLLPKAYPPYMNKATPIGMKMAMQTIAAVEIPEPWVLLLGLSEPPRVEGRTMPFSSPKILETTGLRTLSGLVTRRRDDETPFTKAPLVETNKNPLPDG